MLKSLTHHLLWVMLLFICSSCGNNEVVVIAKGGFELIQRGANSLEHRGGNLQLWYVPKSGKRALVWTYIVGAPEIFEGLAVFSGGLDDERRWQGYPAVLAFTPGGAPVEITEMITRKCCIAQKIEYASIAGAYRYRVELSSNGLFQVHGMKLPQFSSKMEWNDVSLSRDEIDDWIGQIRKGGIKKSYGGVEYLVPGDK